MSTKGLFCKQHRNAPVFEDYRAGDLICSECGVVVGDRVIDVRSEWRTFGNSDKKKNNHDPSRVGMAEDTLMGGSDLSTLVSQMAGGIELPWARWQSRNSMPSDARSLRQVFDNITKTAGKMNLSNAVISQAKQIYKQIDEKKAVKGRKLSACAAACLYIACRNSGYPRSFREICAVSDHTSKEVGRCYKAIIKVLDKSVLGSQGSDYISRFGSILKISLKTQQQARHVSKMTGDLGITAGKNPLTVAAASIFLVSQVSDTPKTPKEIAEVTGMSDSTIKQCYKEMYPVRYFLFTPDFEFHSNLSDVPCFGGSKAAKEVMAAISRRQLQAVSGEPKSQKSSKEDESNGKPLLKSLTS